MIITNENYAEAVKNGWFAAAKEVSLYNLLGVKVLPDMPAATYVWLENLPGVTVLPDMPAAIDVRLENMPGLTVLAYDGNYKLYRSRSGGYYAGCRAFSNAKYALKHWNRSDKRAKLFSAAIRNSEGLK